MKQAVSVALLVLAMGASTLVRGQVPGIMGGPMPLNDVPEETPWSEKEIPLPSFPRDEDLLEFYVGPTATNRFFIDKTSIAPGEDGVVRYTLVIRTSGGAVNVTFEGIRCDTGEVKTYGIGRSDGSWVKSRTPTWKPIENKPINRHHAALRMEYFCAQGMIRNQADGIAALKRGPLR